MRGNDRGCVRHRLLGRSQRLSQALADSFGWIPGQNPRPDRFPPKRPDWRFAMVVGDHDPFERLGLVDSVCSHALLHLQRLERSRSSVSPSQHARIRPRSECRCHLFRWEEPFSSIEEWQDNGSVSATCWLHFLPRSVGRASQDTSNHRGQRDYASHRPHEQPRRGTPVSGKLWLT